MKKTYDGRIFLRSVKALVRVTLSDSFKIKCLQVKENLNRICKNTRPKADPRPGYTFDLDVIYWRVKSYKKKL